MDGTPSSYQRVAASGDFSAIQVKASMASALAVAVTTTRYVTGWAS
jgi:hypothetical protein